MVSHGVSSPLNRLLPTDTSFVGNTLRSTRRPKIIAFAGAAIIVSLFLFAKEISGYRSEPQLRLHQDIAVPVQRIHHSTVTHTTTIHAPAVTETLTVYKEIPSAPQPERITPLEPIIFSLIAWSASSGAELALLTKVRRTELRERKSILMLGCSLS